MFKKELKFLVTGLSILGIFLLPKAAILAYKNLDKIVKADTKPGVVFELPETPREFIDNRDNAGEEYMFKVKVGENAIEIGNKKSGLPGYKITDDFQRMISLELNPYNLGLTEAGKRPVIRLASKKDAVWFVYSGLAVKYSLWPDGGVKADYVLKYKPSRNTFNFALSYSDTFFVLKQPPGSIAAYSFIENGGSPIFEILNPVIKKADGQKINGKINFGMEIKSRDLKRRAVKSNLNMAIDRNFLEKAQYPLIIDPIVETIGYSTAEIHMGKSSAQRLFKDSKGNYLVMYVQGVGTGQMHLDYSNNGGSSWTTTTNTYDPATIVLWNGAIDSNNLFHLSFQINQGDQLAYGVASPSYGGDSTIDSISFSSTINIHAVSKYTPNSIQMLILNNGSPAMVYGLNTSSPIADSSVWFARCITTGKACVDTTKWCNAANSSCGTGTGDKLFSTAANANIFGVTIAQVPSGASTNADNLIVYFSQESGAALKRVIAACSNCAASPPTWTWGAVDTRDSSTVSTARESDVNAFADSTNNRIVYMWASTSTTDCGAATTYCLLTRYRNFSTASASESSVQKVLPSSTTEANVPTTGAINYIAGRKEYYVVTKNSGGSIVWYSMPDSWTSWSGANTLETTTTGSSPHLLYNDPGVFYQSATSTGKFSKLPAFDQAAYRWFNNNNSAQIGSALTAAQNQTATAPAQGTAFRLRLLLHNDALSVAMGISSASFNLLFAGKGGGSCASPAGTPSSYTNISTTSSISFADNAAVSDGVAMTASPSVDPFSGSPENASKSQTYEEANAFKNSVSAIASGSDSIWDFALKDLDADANTAFCFKTKYSASGGALDTYDQYPEITTAAAGGAVTLTLTIDAGGQIAFGSISPGTQRINTTPCTNKCTTRLKTDQTGASSLNITVGRQRAITDVTLASNASPLVTVNQVSDTAGGINVFDGLSPCMATAIWPAAAGASSGLGFTLWADSNSSKNTTCWGSGTTQTDALNKYAALQASAAASSFITISSSPPATLYTSMGYSLEVSSTQKATSYNGGVVFTATAVP